ncbi:MAG: NnrU family protein [Polyangiaceae bacterium]
MDPLDRLALAATGWVALHVLVSGSPLRGALLRGLGERGFRATFSLASLASLSFLWTSFHGSPCAPLWVLPQAFGFLPLLVMPFALFLMAGAFSVPNPTAVGGESALGREQPARGVLRITRHPFLWGVVVWSSAHLLVIGGRAASWFFGSLLVTALLGTRSIDRKRARSGGEAWRSYAKQTSNLPFAAIVSGRNRWVLSELRMPLLLAFGLTLALLAVHSWLFGVSPIPV